MLFPTDFITSDREKHFFLRNIFFSLEKNSIIFTVNDWYLQIYSSVKSGEVLLSPVMRDHNPRISP